MRSIFEKEYGVCLAVLVEARRRAGLTQQELARRLRKPQSFVAKFETRQRRLDVAEYLMIMRAVGVLPPAAIDEITRRDRTMNVRHRARK